jgi:GNAT superfamily N-acetyltransferase
LLTGNPFLEERVWQTYSLRKGPFLPIATRESIALTNTNLSIPRYSSGDAATGPLARLAVDHREQGKGFGKALLKDAILRTMQAAEIAGLKLLLVHAKDEAAADFYRKHGFEPVLDDPLKLFLPVPLSA